MTLEFFKKRFSMRSKAGGFVMGGVAMEIISRTFRLSGSRIVPLTYSGIFFLVDDGYLMKFCRTST